MSPSSKLFQPIQVGDIHLKHRVVLAPLTRFRNTPNHVPTDLSVEYYSQRASTPGTLLITEATVVGEKAGGFDHVPHLETEEQIVAWRKVRFFKKYYDGECSPNAFIGDRSCARKGFLYLCTAMGVWTVCQSRIYGPTRIGLRWGLRYSTFKATQNTSSPMRRSGFGALLSYKPLISESRGQGIRPTVCPCCS